MGKSRKVDKGAVKVHVTFLGGMYVDADELLRSDAAKRTTAKMPKALGHMPQEPQEGVRPTERAD